MNEIDILQEVIDTLLSVDIEDFCAGVNYITNMGIKPENICDKNEKGYDVCKSK